MPSCSSEHKPVQQEAPAGTSTAGSAVMTAWRRRPVWDDEQGEEAAQCSERSTEFDRDIAGRHGAGSVRIRGSCCPTGRASVERGRSPDRGQDTRDDDRDETSGDCQLRVDGAGLVARSDEQGAMMPVPIRTTAPIQPATALETPPTDRNDIPPPPTPTRLEAQLSEPSQRRMR